MPASASILGTGPGVMVAATVVGVRAGACDLGTRAPVLAGVPSVGSQRGTYLLIECMDYSERSFSAA